MPETILNRVVTEKLVFQGYGLAHSGGKTVFIEQGIPGEIADLVITHEKQNTIFARKRQVLTPSPHYRDPGCEAFGECGGCDWLQIDPAAQTKAREEIIADTFRQLNLPATVFRPIVTADPDLHYRNKCFMPLCIRDGKPVAGMYARKSHEIVTHRQCRLYPPEFDEIVSMVTDGLARGHARVYDEATHSGSVRHIGVRKGYQTGDIVVVIVTKTHRLPFSGLLVRDLTNRVSGLVGIVQNINPHPGNIILGDETRILWGNRTFRTRIGQHVHHVDYRSFLQVHSQVAEKLYDAIANEIDPGETVLDAYGGIGAIGFHLADKAGQVITVESNRQAVEDGMRHKAETTTPNIGFVCGTVEGTMLGGELPRFDTIVFDPPRKGLDPRIIDVVLTCKPRKIIYSSCNPPTQARDAKKLTDGGYKVVSVQPFDMFPQTWHIENLMVLVH